MVGIPEIPHQKIRPPFSPGLVILMTHMIPGWINDPPNGWGVNNAHMAGNDWALHLCLPPGDNDPMRGSNAGVLNLKFELKMPVG